MPIRKAILAKESVIRLACFLATFVLMALWESVAIGRHQSMSRWWRWPNHFGISFINTVVTWVVAAVGAVGFSLVAEHRAWGLIQVLELLRGGDAPVRVVKKPTGTVPVGVPVECFNLG